MAATLSIIVAQTALAARPIYSAGGGSIKQDNGAELDEGVFNGPGPNDIRLKAVTNSKRYIVPLGSVFILRMPSKPTYSECKDAALVDQSYRTSNNVGRWFCLRTDQNRVASFKIVSDTPGEKLPINYVTWCKNSDDCVHP